MSKKKNKQRNGSRGVKTLLLSQYGCRCILCGKIIKGGRKQIQLHHIVRIADGGLTTLDNGALVCDSCHKYIHSYDRTPLYRIIANQIRANKLTMIKKNYCKKIS